MSNNFLGKSYIVNMARAALPDKDAGDVLLPSTVYIDVAEAGVPEDEVTRPIFQLTWTMGPWCESCLDQFDPRMLYPSQNIPMARVTLYIVDFEAAPLPGQPSLTQAQTPADWDYGLQLTVPDAGMKNGLPVAESVATFRPLGDPKGNTGLLAYITGPLGTAFQFFASVRPGPTACRMKISFRVLFDRTVDGEPRFIQGTFV